MRTSAWLGRRVIRGEFVDVDSHGYWQGDLMKYGVFDWKTYIQLNPGLEKKWNGPLRARLHWYLFGRSEGRRIFERKDPESLARAVRTWRDFNHNKIDRITGYDVAAFTHLSAELAAENILGNPQIVGRSMKTIPQLLLLKDDEKQALRSFLGKVLSPEFCADLVASALDQGRCCVANPFGEGDAVCAESYHPLEDVTALRFINPSGETFFLIQRVTSADAIYFPTRNIIFLGQHFSLEHLALFVEALRRHFKQVLTYARQSPEAAFGGVLASVRWPAHFYRDICLGAYFLHQRGLMKKIPAIYLHRGEDYFSIKELFEAPCREYLKKRDFMWHQAKERRCFYVHIGSEGSLDIKARSAQEAVRVRITRRAAALVGPKTLEHVKRARECFPLLWFGITSQKRSWVEQVEGGATIIQELAKRYPRIGIVFDGWTCPMSPSKSDLIEVSKDQRCVEAIVRLLPTQVKTFSVVGFTTVKKLAFAAAIDAFIANGGTGSMHVARFAQKPGVQHLSRAMSQDRLKMMALPLDVGSLSVPADKVVDIPAPRGSGSDRTSYSIDPHVILEMVQSVLP